MSNQQNYSFTVHAEVAIEAREIKKEWIFETLQDPELTEKDKEDPELLHYLKKIESNSGRILRVIVNYQTDPQRVITAFFDRGMRNKL